VTIIPVIVISRLDSYILAPNKVGNFPIYSFFYSLTPPFPSGCYEADPPSQHVYNTKLALNVKQSKQCCKVKHINQKCISKEGKVELILFVSINIKLFEILRKHDELCQTQKNLGLAQSDLLRSSICKDIEGHLTLTLLGPLPKILFGFYFLLKGVHLSCINKFS
jgi:hypothetical protein